MGGLNKEGNLDGGPFSYKIGPPQGAPPSPYYGCGGDHRIKYFPDLRNDRPPTLGLPPLTRFYTNCGVKYLVHDCPSKPKNMAQGYSKLNRNLAFPTKFKSEMVVTLQAIARAHAQTKDKEP